MYKVVYPISETLKKHIVSYTILEKFDEEISYFAFPQRGNTIAFIKNAVIEIHKNELTISEKKTEGVKLLALGKYLNPLKICYKTAVPEIAINFTETGINYFFKNYFSDIALKDIQLASFNPESENTLFSENFEDSIHRLEEYLLKKIRDLDLTNIEMSISIISENPSIQTKELATKVHLSEKTLNRHFQKYVGCTTTQFKKIVKFRNSIETYFEGRIKNLTELCYDNNYCDSPDFYRQISKISGFKPSQFFREITEVSTDNFPYILK